MHHVRTHRYFLLISGLLLLVFLFLVPITMRAAVSHYTYTSVADVPRSDIALVLGASVVRGMPSPVLAERAEAAIALYRAGKVRKILVTGDSSASSYDEVTPVRKYLLNAEIPSSDILLDHAGFDTYSSLYRAREVFLVRSVIVVTQDFHLPRALWIGKHLGLTVHGLTAEGGERSVHNSLREIPASLKALTDILMHREPR